MTTALSRLAAAAMLLLPVVASAQAPFQPPPDSFQTPSGNVHCRFAEATLRCQVLERTFDPPPGCSPWPGHLTLRAESELTLPCEGATSIRNDEAFVLGYGARWIKEGITCESEEAGLRCANGAGRGFQVSRSRMQVF